MLRYITKLIKNIYDLRNFYLQIYFIYMGILKGKKKEQNMARVLISMPEKFLDEIDKVAGNENRTRSELIREALRSYMYRNQIRNSKQAGKNAEILEALLG